MKTVVFYYTGTGNSLWSARQLAEKLGGAKLLHMKCADALAAGEAEVVGFVFPVHVWGLPLPVVEFVKKLSLRPETYLFALAVNAGQVSRTLVQLQEMLARRGLKLAAGFDIVLPSNYIPWGGAAPAEKQQERFAAARARLEEAAACISAREAGPVEMGPLWQRIVFTAIYKMSFNQVHKMDKDFWCDDTCNACEICVRICPAGNIEMKKGRPAWKHQCEQCLACIQWCPQESIQFGKKTPAYERYRHPEVSLPDMIAGVGGR
ncbi:MAG: EFR1 family ferrodoxin [Acidobacteriota bacterium]|jgi:NAD-dependent dihydropyrimidine dehydrogenase PreA subunit|nr:EFR1 family ferrodoxin [Acidobacteriota bacterium]